MIEYNSFISRDTGTTTNGITYNKLGVYGNNYDIREETLKRNIGKYRLYSETLNPAIGKIIEPYEYEGNLPATKDNNGILDETHNDANTLAKKLISFYGWDVDKLEAYISSAENPKSMTRWYGIYDTSETTGDYVEYIKSIQVGTGNLVIKSYADLLRYCLSAQSSDRNSSIASIAGSISNKIEAILSYVSMDYELDSYENPVGIIRDLKIPTALANGNVKTTNPNAGATGDTEIGAVAMRMYSNTLYNAAKYTTYRRGKFKATNYITTGLSTTYGNSEATINVSEGLPILVTGSIYWYKTLSRIKELDSNSYITGYTESNSVALMASKAGVTASEIAQSNYGTYSPASMYAGMTKTKKTVLNVFSGGISESTEFSKSSSFDKGSTSATKKKLFHNDGEGSDSPSIDNTFETATISKIPTGTTKDLLTRTSDLFNKGGIQTILGKFYNGNDKEDSLTQTAIDSKYGVSHGRNLLKLKSTTANGYDNPYCRVWTYHHQYSHMRDRIRPFIKDDGAPVTLGDYQKGWKSFRNYNFDYTFTLNNRLTLDYENGLVNITPTKDTGTKKINIENCMFSIENLAWRDINFNGKGTMHFDNNISAKEQNDNTLSEEQIGPNGGRIMWFPPYDIQFSENTNASWTTNEFIGRGEPVYTYNNTRRSGTLSFTIVIDHPSILNYWNQNSVQDPETTALRFFAGCETLTPVEGVTGVGDKDKDNNNNGENKNTKTEGGKKYDVTFFTFWPNDYSFEYPKNRKDKTYTNILDTNDDDWQDPIYPLNDGETKADVFPIYSKKSLVWSEAEYNSRIYLHERFGNYTEYTAHQQKKYGDYYDNSEDLQEFILTYYNETGDSDNTHGLNYLFCGHGISEGIINLHQDSNENTSENKDTNEKTGNTDGDVEADVLLNSLNEINNTIAKNYNSDVSGDEVHNTVHDIAFYEKFVDSEKVKSQVEEAVKQAEQKAATTPSASNTKTAAQEAEKNKNGNADKEDLLNFKFTIVNLTDALPLGFEMCSNPISTYYTIPEDDATNRYNQEIIKYNTFEELKKKYDYIEYDCIISASTGSDNPIIAFYSSGYDSQASEKNIASLKEEVSKLQDTSSKLDTYGDSDSKQALEATAKLNAKKSELEDAQNTNTKQHDKEQEKLKEQFSDFYNNYMFWRYGPVYLWINYGVKGYETFDKIYDVATSDELADELKDVTLYEQYYSEEDYVNGFYNKEHKNCTTITKDTKLIDVKTTTGELSDDGKYNVNFYYIDNTVKELDYAKEIDRLTGKYVIYSIFTDASVYEVRVDADYLIANGESAATQVYGVIRTKYTDKDGNPIGKYEDIQLVHDSDCMLIAPVYKRSELLKGGQYYFDDKSTWENNKKYTMGAYPVTITVKISGSTSCDTQKNVKATAYSLRETEESKDYVTYYDFYWDFESSDLSKDKKSEKEKIATKMKESVVAMDEGLDKFQEIKESDSLEYFYTYSYLRYKLGENSKTPNGYNFGIPEAIFRYGVDWKSSNEEINNDLKDNEYYGRYFIDVEYNKSYSYYFDDSTKSKKYLNYFNKINELILYILKSVEATDEAKEDKEFLYSELNENKLNTVSSSELDSMSKNGVFFTADMSLYKSKLMSKKEDYGLNTEYISDIFLYDIFEADTSSKKNIQSYVNIGDNNYLTDWYTNDDEVLINNTSMENVDNIFERISTWVTEGTKKGNSDETYYDFLDKFSLIDKIIRGDVVDEDKDVNNIFKVAGADSNPDYKEILYEVNGTNISLQDLFEKAKDAFDEGSTMRSVPGNPYENTDYKAIRYRQRLFASDLEKLEKFVNKLTKVWLNAYKKFKNNAKKLEEYSKDYSAYIIGDDTVFYIDGKEMLSYTDFVDKIVAAGSIKHYTFDTFKSEKVVDNLKIGQYYIIESGDSSTLQDKLKAVGSETTEDWFFPIKTSSEWDEAVSNGTACVAIDKSNNTFYKISEAESYSEGMLKLYELSNDWSRRYKIVSTNKVFKNRKRYFLGNALMRYTAALSPMGVAEITKESGYTDSIYNAIVNNATQYKYYSSNQITNDNGGFGILESYYETTLVPKDSSAKIDTYSTIHEALMFTNVDLTGPTSTGKAKQEITANEISKANDFSRLYENATEKKIEDGTYTISKGDNAYLNITDTGEYMGKKKELYKEVIIKSDDNLESCNLTHYSTEGQKIKLARITIGCTDYRVGYKPDETDDNKKYYAKFTRDGGCGPQSTTLSLRKNTNFHKKDETGQGYVCKDLSSYGLNSTLENVIRYGKNAGVNEYTIMADATASFGEFYVASLLFKQQSSSNRIAKSYKKFLYQCIKSVYKAGGKSDAEIESGITVDSEKRINTLVEKLNKLNKNGGEVLIQGYANAHGTDVGNQKLYRGRCHALYLYFRDFLGLEEKTGKREIKYTFNQKELENEHNMPVDGKTDQNLTSSINSKLGRATWVQIKVNDESGDKSDVKNASTSSGSASKSNVKDSNPHRYDYEREFFERLPYNAPLAYKKLTDKIKYFNPAFHSITPEGFNARLTFLQQCMRQGPTVSVSDGGDTNDVTASNLAFGRPPFCVLRLGDFLNTRILVNSLNISYGDMQWDLNPEGIGVQPMLANVSMNIEIVGGSSLSKPVSKLQNAVSFNYYANTNLYDNRADFFSNPPGSTYEDMHFNYWEPTFEESITSAAEKSTETTTETTTTTTTTTNSDLREQAKKALIGGAKAAANLPDDLKEKLGIGKKKS